DRGLTAVLVSLVRLADLELNANDGAGKLVQGSRLVQAAIAEIAQRADSLAGPEGQALVTQALRARVDEWMKRKASATGAQLGYQTKRDGRTIGLLKAPGEERWDAFTCLNSLRDVEPTINLILNDEGTRPTIGPAWRFDRNAPATTDETENSPELT